MASIRLVKIALALPFVVIGLGFAGYGVYTGYYQVQQVNSAVEETPGTIQSSNVTEVRETEEGETELEYYPRITYTYTVDGKTYTGERILSRLERSREPGERAGVEYDSERRAREVAAQFPEGGKVTVYYYEADPDRSFLDPPEVDWVGTLAFGGFGVVFALLAIRSTLSIG